MVNLKEEPRVLVITAQFNELVTNALKNGAIDFLLEQGLEATVDGVSVPGAFELPLAASVAAKSKKWDAIICLGCVIRGETPHFDFVAGECAKGIMDIQISTGVPISFGVLTTDTADQALARCGLKGGNKGRDAAAAALHMFRLIKELV